MTNPEKIADGMVVGMHYTLTDGKGHVIDTSTGDEPMMYLHGADNIVPGLEKKLVGRSVGDNLTAVVSPADGYGERRGPGPQEIPLSSFGDDEPPKAGMQVIIQTQDGEAFPLWVVKVDDENVWLDHNHPLAGVTLHFDVQVMSIRDATDEELAHGHPHGPGGHHDH